MDNQDVIEICQQCFLKHGWKTSNGAAIATKEFQSVVGVKAAFVYFLPSDSYNYGLAGNYQSQGRNILEPNWVLIPQQTTAEDIYNLTIEFINVAEAVISESYGVRILKLLQQDRDSNNRHILCR